MSKKQHGNQNARKGLQRMTGLLQARCQPREEGIVADASQRLGLGKSDFIREAAVRLALDVTENGAVPEWAKMAKS